MHLHFQAYEHCFDIPKSYKNAGHIFYLYIHTSVLYDYLCLRQNYYILLHFKELSDDRCLQSVVLKVISYNT